ncbi:MAG: UDP-N-acetylmuramoyl-tripeptide--D-alanyl-D-alanine ligase [Actinomycetota bacterium]|nr:UDP-N-acetylmuramoyl-tripeptide--D-alanyl-D-alanine ligase [Actinomycetota bacterium]
MRPEELSRVAEILGGRRIGPDTGLERAVVDSRVARPGDLFFALPGERTDGHRFAAEASARRAACVVRETDALVEGGSAVVVPDPSSALLGLARNERNEVPWTVVGVTGSVGKTTAKDFLREIVSTRTRVHASPRSFNNRIGVPLTILGAPTGTKVLVCELGAGRVGDIEEFCGVLRPHIGIVTIVGIAHLETFGSVRAIATAKSELPRALPNEGIAVLNVDDPAVGAFGEETSAGLIGYGRSPEADVRAEEVMLDGTGFARFVVRWRNARAEVRLPVPGAHMLTPALAAIAAGLALGVPLETRAAAVEIARLSPGRMELLRGRNGSRIVDDAYNANPTSVAAALRTLRHMAREGRAIAVLGEMAELGELAPLEHRRIGSIAAAIGIDVLVTVGAEAGEIAAAVDEEGPGSCRVHACGSAREAVTSVGDLRAGDVVLVKGSRIAGLERVVAELRTP